MLRNTPKSVIDAVSGIMKESRKKADEEHFQIEGKMQLRAMNKVQMEYVVPEGIEKEARAHFMGAAAAAHKSGKKSFNFQGKTYPVQIKKHVAKKVNEADMKISDKDITKAAKKIEKTENKDTPGNSYSHQCANHVKHEKFGEGKTLFSQHADPDEDGNVAWYDVMFEHGIEKKVSIDELKVLTSSNHGSHKKKTNEEVEQIDEATPTKKQVKMAIGIARDKRYAGGNMTGAVKAMDKINKGLAQHPKVADELRKQNEDVEEVDEARGRPKKGGGSSEDEPDQNIVVHLKKSIDTNGAHHVKFGDGSKKQVPHKVASKVLAGMSKLKPDQRLEIQNHIGKNHKNLMQVHGMLGK